MDSVTVGELADEIAAKVADRLGGSVVPAEIPADIGDELGAVLGRMGGPWRWAQVLPISGAYSLRAEYLLSSDGSISIELFDWTGARSFWRGTLRPPAAGLSPWCSSSTAAAGYGGRHGFRADCARAGGRRRGRAVG